MYFEIVNEYKSLLNKKNSIEEQLKSCPKGYIYKQKSGNKEYAYLKYRNGATVESTYKNEDVAFVESQLAARKEKEDTLPQINKRLLEIEKAAVYLSSNLSRQLNMLKLSAPMETLSNDEKSLSLSFSDAMISIEGVSVTDDVRLNLYEWESGKKTFAYVFEQTLKQYGFLPEV